MSRILTVDIGNSNIVVGSFDGEQLEFIGRIVTKRDYTTEEIVSEIAAMLSGWQQSAEETKNARMNASTSDKCSNDESLSVCEKQNTSDSKSYDGSILASVVPEITDVTLDALEKIIGKRPLLMGPFLRTGVDISRYKEGAIGMDRIVDMAAAVSLYGAPVMVCDLGTCTTITVADACTDNLCGADEESEKASAGLSDCSEEEIAGERLSGHADEEVNAGERLSGHVDEEIKECTSLSGCSEEGKCKGEIIGGMICPGIQLSLDAEASRASQLPQLSAGKVDSLLGLDTASNMMSGVVAGTGMMIAELARRLAPNTFANQDFSKEDDTLESKRHLNVVVTGGLGRLVIPWIENKDIHEGKDTTTDFEVHYEPDLLLYGLKYIYDLNSDN